jgi:hypothetical protein
MRVRRIQAEAEKKREAYVQRLRSLERKSQATVFCICKKAVPFSVYVRRRWL